MSQLVRRNVLRGATAVAAAVAMAVVGSVSPAVAEESETTEHLTFESYAREALGGQNGCRPTDDAAEVVAGPLNGNNQVLEMTGASHRASRAIPEILDEDTGTLFFRFYRSGGVDTSFGITDVDQPTTYTDSRAYVNNQNSDTNARPRRRRIHARRNLVGERMAVRLDRGRQRVR